MNLLSLGLMFGMKVKIDESQILSEGIPLQAYIKKFNKLLFKYMFEYLAKAEFRLNMCHFLSENLGESI